MSHLEFWANLQTLEIHVAGPIIASSLTINDKLYQRPLFIAWLRFPRILQFSCLKPGGFTWVVTPRKERDDQRYAWENITFLRSRWKLASLSSSKVIHFNFIIMVNFKSSSFDKGTGGKSGKFQFDCDGYILFTRNAWNKYYKFIFLFLMQSAFLCCFSQQNYR